MSKVTVLNTLVVKRGHVGEFIATQSAFTSAMVSTAKGLIGGRMYKSVDGSKVVLISQFESKEAQSAIMRSEAFAAHLDKQRPLVESSSPVIYEEAYTYGKFG